MKCVKCGAEMKEGCIYCSVCGHESKIMPDYNLLEDDYLRTILKEENRKDSETTRKKKTGQKPPVKKKMSSKVPIIVVCCLLAVAILAGIAVKLYIDDRNANSYDYQVEMAGQEAVDKNYENALHYYKTALALKPDDIAVRLAMSDIYMEQKDYDSAMVLLIEVIDLEDTNEQAYQNLIHIYEEKGDYGSIAELASGITDINILKLFDEYLVASPVISPVDGDYEDYTEVTLYSMEGYDIYYTINGAEPDEETGILYNDRTGILLDESGQYLIQAVCVNDRGISSDVVTASYFIEILPPDFAKVSPDGGTIAPDTPVTIEAEEGCSIYYTWDGTDPTKFSAKYEGPLEIPYGNNILSVLVVNDKTGLDSGVYRTNFIYYP